MLEPNVTDETKWWPKNARQYHKFSVEADDFSGDLVKGYRQNTSGDHQQTLLNNKSKINPYMEHSCQHL